MPYTPAHPAAALPFRKTGLIYSAVIVGSMAPDFEYFARLMPHGRFGHSLAGLVVLTLPLGVLVLWLYHRAAKFALLRLAPNAMQRRIEPQSEFRFGGARRFGLIVLSVMVGAITHVTWDLFTHSQSWLVERWAALRAETTIRWLCRYPIPMSTVLHRISSIAGVAIVLVYIFVWMLRTRPVHRIERPLAPGWKLSIVLLLVALACCLGWLHRTHVNYRRIPDVNRLGVFAVTATAALWWELVVVGMLWQRIETAQAGRAGRSWAAIPGGEAVSSASRADTHTKSTAVAPPAQ